MVYPGTPIDTCVDGRCTSTSPVLVHMYVMYVHVCMETYFLNLFEKLYTMVHAHMYR